MRFRTLPIVILIIFHAEGEISGLCFLGLSEEDWKNCGLSRAGVIAVTKLQEKIKTAQTTTNSLSHVPGITADILTRAQTALMVVPVT